MTDISSIKDMTGIGGAIFVFLGGFIGFVKLLSTVHIAIRSTEENKSLIQKLIEEFKYFRDKVITLDAKMMSVENDQNEIKQDIRWLSGNRTKAGYDG